MSDTCRAAVAERLGIALASAMPAYGGLPPDHRGRWRPAPVRRATPWASQLDGYVWAQRDLAATTDLFRQLGEQLLKGGAPRLGAARSIRSWGFPGRGGLPESSEIDHVVTTALELAQGGPVGPDAPVWSAYWTKVACAATIHLDLHPGMTPQAIWDSRVATAVCVLLEVAKASPEDLGIAAGVLRVPPSRPGVGLRRRSPVSGAGRRWRACNYGRPSPTNWASQAFASQLLAACARHLNARAEAGRSDWTSFAVAAALFVEGY